MVALKFQWIEAKIYKLSNLFPFVCIGCRHWVEDTIRFLRLYYSMFYLVT